MKKQIQAFISSLGGTSAYAGNTQHFTELKGIIPNEGNKNTLFINDPIKVKKKGEKGIKARVEETFGKKLPFTLKTN